MTTDKLESSSSTSAATSTTTLSWLHPKVIIGIATTTASILFFSRIYSTGLKRYPTILHLPPSIYDRPPRPKTLYGLVTSVGDGDNFRFYHTPAGSLGGWGTLRRVPNSKRELKGNTIHVRLAGIDAPELPHFGNEEQPYAREALAWLRTLLMGRNVRIQIHSRDRFERVVANVTYRAFPWIWVKRDVSVQMARTGLAAIFREGGREYGGLLRELEEAEGYAKRKRLGMWKLDQVEVPGAYKKRTRAGEDAVIKASVTEKQKNKERAKGITWIRWLFGSDLK